MASKEFQLDESAGNTLLGWRQTEAGKLGTMAGSHWECALWVFRKGKPFTRGATPPKSL